MDVKLVRLAEAVEGGHVFPEIAVALGGSVARGIPVPTGKFFDALANSLGETRWRQMDGRERKKRKGDGGLDDVWAEIRATLAPLFGDDSEGALSLAPAQIVIGEKIVKVPALRISIGSVQTWWLPGTAEEKTPASGGTFFGLAVPLNLSN